MLVEQQHACLWRHRDFLSRRLAIVGVEHRLPTRAAVGGRREVQEQRPGRLGRDGLGCLRRKRHYVGVVI